MFWVYSVQYWGLFIVFVFDYLVAYLSLFIAEVGRVLRAENVNAGIVRRRGGTHIDSERVPAVVGLFEDRSG